MVLEPVIVEWEDAAEIARHDPSVEIRPFYMTTIGFLIKEDSNRLILASIVPQDREECSLLILPRGMVKKITRMKSYVPGKGDLISGSNESRRTGRHHKVRSSAKRHR